GYVESKVLDNILKVNGTVNVPPQNLVSVMASIGGFVKNISLVQGSPVRKGEIVVTIENTEFIELQQNYLDSRSRLEYIETDYNRQKELYRQNVSSAKTWQQSVAEYKSLKTKVNALEQKLAMIGIDIKQLKEEHIQSFVAIHSPINGYVKTINVNAGKYVSSSDVIMEIVNNENLTLELTLFEKDIDKVSTGQKINFSLPDKKDRALTATIYQTGKAINNDHTVKVYATIDKADKGLLSGMYITAYIETKNNLVEALPEEAVVTFGEHSYIFVERGRHLSGKKEVNTFEMMEVKKGLTVNGYTEVILPEKFNISNSKIAIKGAYSLLSAKKNAGEMAC
ncbi:MAG: efflux RND transporter periplasmic adaptor subunit, partial [Bacteroidota bacterium]|nr:efflux RND transporter periplasmic adaptor subunit [Bacteroidota bacterium]